MKESFEDRHVVTVTDIAFGGEGVAKVGGLVVFIPFVIAGEKVEIEIVEVKKKFARARLLGVLEPSPHRVQPPCIYFGDCGGCQYQHVAYPVQLQLKGKQISDLFRRIGGFAELRIDPVIRSPRQYGYRNRIMVRSQWNKIRRILHIGFIRFDNRLVVDIEECKIAEPTLNEQLRAVRAQPPPKGGLKVVLRIPPEGWHVPKDSFFQNNFHLLPQLIEAVRSKFRNSRCRYLIDVYCGVGFFSLELADLAEHFAGVELDRFAIAAARQNASDRKIQNGEFVNGTAEDWLPALLKRFPAEATAVLLDPPRTGCPPEMLEAIRTLRPAQVLYISCHPATLARDAKLLCASGVYQPLTVTPLDMFPQTQHVECVADFRRS